MTALKPRFNYKRYGAPLPTRYVRPGFIVMAAERIGLTSSDVYLPSISTSATYVSNGSGMERWATFSMEIESQLIT